MSTLFLIVSSFLMSALSLAADASSSLPVTLSADKIGYDHNSRSSIYQGHVKMRQGENQLLGNKMVVYQDAHHKISKIVVTGNPAHFYWVKPQEASPVEGEADSITFTPQDASLILQGRVHLTKDAH